MRLKICLKGDKLKNFFVLELASFVGKMFKKLLIKMLKICGINEIWEWVDGWIIF
jgi:hypothetical protein